MEQSLLSIKQELQFCLSCGVKGVKVFSLNLDIEGNKTITMYRFENMYILLFQADNILVLRVVDKRVFNLFYTH